jgi:hypothetical protein
MTEQFRPELFDDSDIRPRNNQSDLVDVSITPYIIIKIIIKAKKCSLAGTIFYDNFWYRIHTRFAGRFKVSKSSFALFDDSDIRPRNNQSDLVDVSITPYIYAILEFDEEKGLFSWYGTFMIEWMDV